MRGGIVLLALAVMCGCSDPVERLRYGRDPFETWHFGVARARVTERVTAFLLRNPDYPEAKRKLLYERRAWIGMSQDEALAAWGLPTDISRDEQGRDVWMYSANNWSVQRLYLRDSRVVEIDG